MIVSPLGAREVAVLHRQSTAPSRKMIPTAEAETPLLTTQVVTIAIVVASLAAGHFWTQSRARRKKGSRFVDQLVMLVLTGLAILAVILVLPIDRSDRDHLLRLFGILVSGAIAFSSTTLLGNIMAGLMMRSLRRLRIKDFVSVEEHYGRVVELGLLHTVIQTEDRDIMALPNLYLSTRPVKIVLEDGTMVSAEVSIGYDVPRKKIEELLVRAAGEAELKEPFVQIRELLDHAVVYRVSGRLEPAKNILATRSRLRARMLDCLHSSGIEIASPNLMMTRQWSEDHKLIPKAVLRSDSTDPAGGVDREVFDIAEAAGRVEELKTEIVSVEEQLKQLAREAGAAAGDADREKLEKHKGVLERKLQRLKEAVTVAEQSLVREEG